MQIKACLVGVSVSHWQVQPEEYPNKLDVLDRQEQDCIFSQFSAEVAWELGCRIREKAQKKSQPVLINITSSNGLVYYQSASSPGVNLDNQSWIERKRRTVMAFDRSSFYIGCKLRKQGRTLAGAFAKSETEYSAHGGGFPIRVAGTEGIVGVIVVSGLRQDEDHLLIVETIKEYLRKE